MPATLARASVRTAVRPGDRAYAEVAAGHPYPEQLVAQHLLAGDHHAPVAVLHDRIPAFERRLRREAADPGPEVVDLVLRPLQPTEHPVAGAPPQAGDQLPLAGHQGRGVGHHRTGEQRTQDVALVVEAPGERSGGPGE